MVGSSQFIDEEYDIKDCQNQILSIQLSLDGFYFCVFDKKKNKFIVFCGYEDMAATPFELKNNLTKFFENNNILAQKYSAVKIIYIQKKVSIAPTFLIDSNTSNDFTDLLFEKNIEEEKILTEIPNISVTVTESVPVLILDFFKEKYQNCTFKSLTAPIYKYIIKHFSSPLQLIVTKYSHHLLVIVIENEKINFYNNFYVKTDEDCIYYLFNVAKLFPIDQLTNIVFFGEIETKSHMVNHIKKYFKNTVFPTFPQDYAVSYKFHKQLDHIYLPLFELALCE